VGDDHEPYHQSLCQYVVHRQLCISKFSSGNCGYVNFCAWVWVASSTSDCRNEFACA